MNVYAYVALVTLVGLMAAYFAGRVAHSLGGSEATIAFLIASFALGVVLAFPVLMAIAKLCLALGLSEKECIRTDQNTVWYLAAPLVLCPAYLVCMFVGRAVGRQKAPDGNLPVA